MGEALLVWKSDNDSNSPNLRPRTKTVKPCFSQSVIPYISSIAVQGLRFFGHWSLVFGPIACASLACQCAAAAAAHEAPPGWDCGRGPKHVVTVLPWFSVFGLGSEHGSVCANYNMQKAFRKPFRKETANHKPPVQEQAQNVGNLRFFHSVIRKNPKETSFIVSGSKNLKQNL